MKDSTPIILLVVFLSLVLAGILIYVFVFAPTATTASAGSAGAGGGAGPGSNAGAVTDDELKALAKKFRDSFQNNWGNFQTARCNAITTTNNLSNDDLNRFKDIYYKEYNKTVKQEMYDAYVWCGVWDASVSGVGQKLYDRL